MPILAAIKILSPGLEAEASFRQRFHREAGPWRGTIVKVREDGQVLVNRGAQEGVNAGLVFVAGESEVLRDPDTGDVLSEELLERARLQVERVSERVAYCKVVGGDAGLLIEGMAVQLVE